MSVYTMALVASFIWGLAAFCEKMGLRAGADPLAGVVARAAGIFLGGVVLLGTVPRLTDKFLHMGWGAFAWIFAGGILASIVGQIFFYVALKAGDLGKITTISGSWPLVAFFLGILLLGEPVNARKLLGVLLVVAGVALLK